MSGSEDSVGVMSASNPKHIYEIAYVDMHIQLVGKSTYMYTHKLMVPNHQMLMYCTCCGEDLSHF